MNQRSQITLAWEQLLAGRANEAPPRSRRASGAKARRTTSAEAEESAAMPHRTPTEEKAQAFFELLREREDLGWDELAKEFRENYYDAFELIVPALFATDDAIIVHNCIQFADLNVAKEADFLEQFVRDANATKHQVALLVLAERGGPGILKVLREKKELPEAARAALDQRSGEESARPDGDSGGKRAPRKRTQRNSTATTSGESSAPDRRKRSTG